MPRTSCDEIFAGASGSTRSWRLWVRGSCRDCFEAAEARLARAPARERTEPRTGHLPRRREFLDRCAQQQLDEPGQLEPKRSSRGRHGRLFQYDCHASAARLRDVRGQVSHLSRERERIHLGRWADRVFQVGAGGISADGNFTISTVRLAPTANQTWTVNSFGNTINSAIRRTHPRW